LDLSALFLRLSYTALPMILAITLHEAAHGYVAHRCGDDTAYRLGRVTLNPLRHIDLYGTILLPAVLLLLSNGRFMFGYAKPVPVSFAHLQRPRRDMVLVAAAGPATNLALALFSALLLRIYVVATFGADGIHDVAQLGWIGSNLSYSILFNILLGVFNMIPLPPLDGGRVAVGLLPEALAVPLARLERYGILILVTLMVLVPMISSDSGTRLDVLAYVADRPLDWMMNVMGWIAGTSYD
jgi:Zn-dependent protease